jgi:hypothetical protein
VSTSPERWRRCSTCKSDIRFDTAYWTCSVSTCNRPRTGLAFCSVSCWDAHVPIMRHRDDAGALDARSPTRAQAAAQARDEEAARTSKAAAPQSAKSMPKATSNPPRSPASARDSEIPREILIVASKLKGYIRARAGFNTSDACMEVLSDHVRAICDRAIENARRDERKTVLERDFPKP